MAEEAARPAEFWDREDLQAWLITQPREVALVIAARSALRVLPLLATAAPPATDLVGQERFPQLITLLFHSVALTRFASLYPSQLNILPWRSTRSLISRIEFSYAAANSVAKTARAALETVLANPITAAADTAQFSAQAVYPAVAVSKDTVGAGSKAEADIWRAVSFDANSLSLGGLLLHQVAERSLWPNGEPEWSLARWAQLQAALSATGNWDCWREWYVACARGEHIAKELETVYATVRPDLWNQGPTAVNSWIVEQLRGFTEKDGKKNQPTKETQPLEFKDRESLEAWLRLKPREVAAIITARTALRVLPLFSQYAEGETWQRRFAELTARLFRANALARTAAAHPTRVHDLRVAAEIAGAAVNAAVKAASDVNAHAAGAAATAFNSLSVAFSAAPSATIAAHAAHIATSAATAAPGDLWTAISADVGLLLEANTSAAALVNQPLWLKHGPPPWAQASWAGLLTALPQDEDWDVWIDWYEGRLRGRPDPEEIEFVYASVPRKRWDEGPAAANAWIKSELARLQNPASGQLETKLHSAREKAEALVGWDFFLSYSGKDEAFARFVDDVLREAGYSVFAQFHDIPAGANFVREMQSGLSHSKRVVALLSPNYLASDHCQAEWSATYNDDASGEKRKLLPLLIAPTDLEPLARQIVFKSLVGLSKRRQAEAILEAIAPRPATPGPPRDRLKGVFDLRADGDQLTPTWAAPSATAGKDYGGLTPQELWADTLHAFADFADFTADPTRHNYLSRDICREAERLRALPRALPARPPLAAERSLAHVLRLIADGERRGEFSKNDTIHYHRSELRGQYQRLAALWPELENYRRSAQIDGFEEADEAARRAQEAILEETAKSKAASPELKAEVTDTLVALREAQESIAPGADMKARRARLYDATKSSVAQIIPIWNWTTNAAQKVGKGSAEAAKLIENLEKLGSRIEHYGGSLWEWVDKWWM